MANWKGASLLILTIHFGQLSHATDKALLATSGPARVQLVELFSSESCSSCPPADQWISGLQNEAGLWQTFVPVVFHVDYWNHLGWKDGLSSDLMTKRQIEISRLWPSPTVYTPAVVVDGKEWRDWRDSKRISLPSSGKTQGISLQIYRESNGHFTVKTAGLKSTKKFVVRAAQLGMDLNSNVTAGENSGLKLKHNFVVLSWDSKTIDGKNLEVQFQFKKPEQKATRLAIAVWVEEEGNPTPLQAVGAYI